MIPQDQRNAALNSLWNVYSYHLLLWQQSLGSMYLLIRMSLKDFHGIDLTPIYALLLSQILKVDLIQVMSQVFCSILPIRCNRMEQENVSIPIPIFMTRYSEIYFMYQRNELAQLGSGHQLLIFFYIIVVRSLH